MNELYIRSKDIYRIDVYRELPKSKDIGFQKSMLQLMLATLSDFYVCVPHTF